jgi:N-acyl-D-aspartate/D-glutamate deacylase
LGRGSATLRLSPTIEGEIIASIRPAGHDEHSEAVEIQGRGFAIFPGFVDIHAHPSSELMLQRAKRK